MLKPGAASIIALVVITLLTGCLPDYFPRRKLRVTGSDHQIVGRWQLTSESATMMSHYSLHPLKASSLELSAGGHCELRDFTTGEDAYSGTGTWAIEEESDDGSKRKFSVLRVAISREAGFFSLYFTKRHRKIILWQYHDDPDGRQYVEYERIEPIAAVSTGSRP
jgi:hypothetical protein